MLRSPDWPAAVLFDFDGVIVDSEPIHLLAFQKVAAEEGITLTEEAYYRELIGFDDRGGFTHLFQQHRRPLDAQSLRRVMDRKATVVREVLDAGAFTALPGVDVLVRSLAAKRLLAICSGALRPEIESMLRGIGLQQYFKTIVSAEDVTVGKPDPQGYLLTIRRLSALAGKPLQPADCLIIEDAPSVIQSVKAAGFRVLGVATSYPLDALRDADFAVNSLRADEINRVIPGLIGDA